MGEKQVSYIILALVVFGVLLPGVLAHETDPSSQDVDVRVVSAEPDTRTYQFACRMDSENDFLRDWFIRADTGNSSHEPEEATFLDLPADTILNYTFEQDRFYHVGCVVVDENNFSKVYRGDMHIDLRTSGWDPEIVPVSGDGLTGTYSCEYSGNGTPSWEVINARTGELTGLEAGNPLVHTVPGHGLYDYICHIDSKSTALPVEYFDDADPYFPDAYGVPDTHAHNDTGENETDPDPVCGNGIVETGESCDDGNLIDGDGCSSTCEEEAVDEPDNTTDPGDNQTTCYESLAGLPALCNGGTITTDTINGCRTVACESSTGSLQVLACEKPNTGEKQYFEMYKQASSGTTPQICIGETCIQNNGFAQSTDYPICLENATTPDNETQPPQNNETDENQTNTTDPGDTNQTTCYESLAGLPATCNGGTITTDSFSGCRQVICTDSSSSLQVLACNKPNEGAAQYFEMYKQSDNPTGLEICLGQTCIQNNGFAQSTDYPICLENATTPDNETQPPQNNETDENQTNTTDPGDTNQTTCYSALEDLPVTCEGELTQDTFTGCRHLTCENAGGSVWVLACNKPNEGAAQYFEMYKQSSSGVTPEVCLAGTCIQNNGYAKSSDYPVCVESPTEPPGNETNSTENTSDVLAQPIWIEPTDGLTGVTLDYFHLATTPPENDEQVASSDWEVWNDELTQRVWAAEGNTGLITYHTHTPDGNFLNGASALEPLTDYQVRVRYQDTSGNYSPWAQWRSFTTRDEQVLNPSSPDWTAKQGYRVEKFASGFDVPVHLAFAPDIYGHLPENERPYLYVTELYGTVKVVYPDGTSSVYADGLLNFDPFGSITGAGQMGLISLYVEPETGDLYVGTVYVEGEDVYNKVIKFTSNGDGDGYSSQQTLIDGLPSGPSHQVEQITKGPDGRLYINLGEGLEPANAQNDSVLAGKIISMNTDGSDVTTYAKGFRNPFGADWRPGTGQLIVTDNAPDQDDRLVYVEEGKNYGWGLNDNFATFNAERIDTLNVSPVDVEFNPGLAEFSELYVAVAGPIYQQGPTTGKHILQYTLNPDASVATREEFVSYTGDGYGTPMGLDFGPDGLYFTDIYGEPGFVGLGETEANIYRVVPGEPGNQTEEQGEFRAGISIIAWYPQDVGDGIEYIFECQGIDGSGNYSYAFDLGTGAFSIEGSRQYVKYPYGDENHTVTCLANDLTTTDQASASITVNPDHFIAE